MHMFSKGTMVWLLVLAGAATYGLYGAYRSSGSRQNMFGSEVDTLYREIRNYRLTYEVRAQVSAAVLAAPYYLKLRETDARISPKDWTGTDCFLDHLTVIQVVARESPECRGAPDEVAREYVRTHTPAYVIADLRAAYQEIAELFAPLRPEEIETRNQLEKIRFKFHERSRRMEQAIAAAEQWHAPPP